RGALPVVRPADQAARGGRGGMIAQAQGGGFHDRVKQWHPQRRDRGRAWTRGEEGMSDATCRPVLDAASLATRAASVLRANDTGTLVTAAPRLYPHMWSWDAAFVSIGLAHLDVGRAIREL